MTADGQATAREVLESVERQTGRRPTDLDGPDIPLELSFLWDWFQELHIARGSNGWGPNPLTYSDIAAWAGLTGTVIRASELKTILILDRLWMVAQAESRKEHQAWQDQQRQRRSQHGR